MEMLIVGVVMTSLVFVLTKTSCIKKIQIIESQERVGVVEGAWIIQALKRQESKTEKQENVIWECIRKQPTQ